ncbi:hypothetical protein N657DRAFT_190172 [Parathielavia appendiculata]|uniref:Uncharacterized protein n=1 Tax=Parathielavia appendiculata TaxID=2587402 RepID=A0AAN6Z7G2_9PEZI|nr:hypothetical protein N657DRAFT_190172 [Parathielavia appendiculata]
MYTALLSSFPSTELDFGYIPASHRHMTQMSVCSNRTSPSSSVSIWLMSLSQIFLTSWFHHLYLTIYREGHSSGTLGAVTVRELCIRCQTRNGVSHASLAAARSGCGQIRSRVAVTAAPKSRRTKAGGNRGKDPDCSVFSSSTPTYNVSDVRHVYASVESQK